MDAQQLQAEADQDEAVRLANLQNDYQRVFLGSEAGLRVLEDLMAATTPFVDTFYGNSRDIFQKGRRQIGLHVIERLGMNTMSGAVRLMVRLGSVDPAAMQEMRIEREAIEHFITTQGNDHG